MPRRVQGNVARAMRSVSAGGWWLWALRGLQPYLRIWEGFLEEVTSRISHAQRETEEMQRGGL